MNAPAGYVPRAGSRAEAAIAALQAAAINRANGGWLSRAKLAEAIDTPLANLDPNLKAAVTHGALHQVARDGKAGYMLATGASPDENAAPGKAARRGPRVGRAKADKRLGRAPANVGGGLREAPSGAHGPRPPRERSETTFALFSDGSLAVAQNGETVSRLAPQETQALIRYLETQQALIGSIFAGMPS